MSIFTILYPFLVALGIIVSAVEYVKANPGKPNVLPKAIVIVNAAAIFAFIAAPGDMFATFVCIWLGAMVLGLGTFYIVRFFAQRRCTTQVMATLTGSRLRDIASAGQRMLKFTFDYQGQTYDVELSEAHVPADGQEPSDGYSVPAHAKGGRKPLRTGDSCALLVNPRNPTHALFANGRYYATGFLAMGAFWAVFGGIILFLALRALAYFVL